MPKIYMIHYGIDYEPSDDFAFYTDLEKAKIELCNVESLTRYHLLIEWDGVDQDSWVLIAECDGHGSLKVHDEQRFGGGNQ